MKTIKQYSRICINKILEQTGFQVVRFTPEANNRYLLSPWLTRKRIRLLRESLEKATEGFPNLAKNLPTEREMETFLESLRLTPVRQQIGGGGIATAMLLWTISKAINPPDIIESGVFRGFTTWVLRQACPEANIQCFDLSFAEVQWKCTRAKYQECDWIQSFAKNTPSRERPTFAFFDDHVDQWRRVREASEFGIQYVFFDDCCEDWQLQTDGQAAFPTIPMLFSHDLSDQSTLEWKTECGEFRYVHCEKTAENTRGLVKRWCRLPDPSQYIGCRGAQSYLLEIEPRRKNYSTLQE